MATTLLTDLLLAATKKRSIFVSYHHDQDQPYYDAFARLVETSYSLIRDNSLDRLIDSDDPDYVMQRIREKHITGTCCTLVLCGPETRWRKYVDWEIKATLDKEHGVIGVNLPNNPRDLMGRVNKPDRLQDNIDSGYASWIAWENLGGPDVTKGYVEVAVARTNILINNSRPLRGRNGV